MQADRSDDFLAGLPADDVAALRALGMRHRFRRGAGLFHDGDRADRVFLVVDGRVKISHFGRDGTEEVIAVVGPSELLGELSAIDGEPRSGTGTALDDVDAIVIPAGEFREFV